MHIRHIWHASSINRVMRKHSIHNHKGRANISNDERDSCSREKNDSHKEFSCKRNSDLICENVSCKLRDTL